MDSPIDFGDYHEKFNLASNTLFSIPLDPSSIGKFLIVRKKSKFITRQDWKSNIMFVPLLREAVKNMRG